MKTTPVTLVMAYYENAGMWKLQAENLRELPEKLRRHIMVVVVDDGSPDHPAQPMDTGTPLQIYRIGIDIRWNQDAARNIGVKHAETDWVLLTDMDHVAPVETWRRLTERVHDPSLVYAFERVSAPEMGPYHPHPNSWFMTREMYDKIGGYDERFAGFYGTDADFKRRLDKHADVKRLKEVLIRYPRDVIRDASTTRYRRKEPYDKPMIDRITDRRNREPNWETLRLSFPYTRVA